MFLLPYLGGNQQAGCEWYNSSSQEGFREREFQRKKEEKWPWKAILFLCKHKHLIEASKKKMDG